MTAMQYTGPIMIPLSRIVKGDNPRRYFDRKKHDDLVASMRVRGVIQPILLRPARDSDDLYAIVVGERRWRAAQEAFGADGSMPAFVREMTDQEALEFAIDENDNRDDASETEQADAAARVLAACRNDRTEASRRLGWSRAKLDRRLALADLSEAVKRALDERRIKVGHAELLAAVPGDKQDKALDTILNAGLDIGKTRELLMRVTQDLAHACFDKTECTICPFNSASQRALFETYIDDGHCTNRGCFELKTQAVEQARLEEQERLAPGERAAAPRVAGDANDANDGERDDRIEPGESADAAGPAVDAGSSRGTEAHSSARSTSPGSASVHKPAVTAKSIAVRTADLREAMWRTALARSLAGNAAHAQTTILVAAMSGTLSQIRPETLKSRAGLLVGASFPDLAYNAKIAEIRALSERQAANVLAVVGAAYAKDVLSFGHVADLARAFEIDLRESWKVDQSFLERYTKEELRFIAQECGLVAHMGPKAFARLLGSRKDQLIAGMLSRIGFDWAGRLPSAMTLDGQYGPPPVRAAGEADAAITDLAA